MKDGGTWNTIAGQPTDDSELALMLARTLVKKGIFDREAIREAYLFWFNSRPFDIGGTTAAGLRNRHDPHSQSNGALMRVSPLGIFGTNHASAQVAEWARQDAAITHIHPVCQTVSALFAMAIAYVIRTGAGFTRFARLSGLRSKRSSTEVSYPVHRVNRENPARDSRCTRRTARRFLLSTGMGIDCVSERALPTAARAEHGRSNH